MESLAHIRIVLDRTSHPGNIGSTARAMKVMGLSDLGLVRPGRFPDAEATALASSADDVLDGATVHDTLDDALAECTMVIGTSARRRSIEQETTDARGAAKMALAAGGSVAMLFGCERSGLDNPALDRCHALIRIPTNPEYGSLNLAQAVQVVCYELRMTALASAPVIESQARMPAPDQRMEVFFSRLARTLEAIRFSTPGQDDTLHRRLRRLFLRARPDDDELNMLNGILSRTLKIADADARKHPSKPNDDR
jgi:TrmH family RNA methyltransferase